MGSLTIGDGYVLRSDGVAVALITLTPPDLRLFDAASLERLLEQYTDVLRACPDRCSLLTTAVPLDISPLVQRLAQALDRAPDLHSYTVLSAMTDWLQLTWSSLVHLRTVRWLVAVPSVAPEVPPSGMWGELLPVAIVGQTVRLSGDPVTEALARARRLVGQLATLGIEPVPTLLPAGAIRQLLRAAFDPVAAESQQHVAALDGPRPLQIAAPETPHGRR
jgi:hypothetical protein